MKSKIGVVGFFCVVLFSSPARALAQQTPTISVKVNVVSIFATVHDRDGKVVKNLSPNDFALTEDGAPQKIEYFSKETDLPLKVGLLVDTSRSQIEVLEQERRASGAFLDRILRPGQDQACVVSFDRSVQVLQGLTSSGDELASALSKLEIPGQYATLIYSAVKQSSEGIMRKESGRKAFILLTDGVAFRDKTSLETAIEYAQSADAIIYSIRFSEHIPPYRVGKALVLGAAKEHGKEVLRRMADETGGAMFEVTQKQTIEDIYSEIEDALRNQYSIGYTPKRSAPDGKYHKIKLTAKDRTLVVRARDGYYSK